MEGRPVIRDAAIRRREVPADVYAALPGGMRPLLRRVYAARNVAPREVRMAMGDLLPVGSLGGTTAAAEFLADAHQRQASVLVVGDFDADGATASALMVRSMRAMGFRNVSYLVPNRFEFGYGLSPGVVELAATRQPDIIITVDNGISSHEGVDRARALGIEVIVTDHHLPGDDLPGARLIVNPNLPGESFASKALSGVGVAFYVMAALARELGRRGQSDPDASRRAVSGCLDLVALGTIADLVRLDWNNRILANEGLRRIRSRAACPGVMALLAAAGRDPLSACAADLAFGAAPRLNAAGRLTDMTLGVECLLAGQEHDARVLAGRLDELNRRRRELQERMQAQAHEQLQGIAADVAGNNQDGLCLFDDSWHQGIVGLVASRVKEFTGRPVVAFAPGEEPGIVKGSARSVDGVHIRDALAAIAARRKVQGMVFGGHAMAAGLRLPRSQLEAFREEFGAEIARQCALADTAHVVLTDGPLEAGELQPAVAEELYFAGPWGQGFPEPLFDNEFAIVGQRVLRDAHLRLVLRHPDGGEPLDAIAFRQTRALPARARLLYRLGLNFFRGRKQQQLVVEHIEYE